MDVELDGEPKQVTHLGLVMVDPDVRGQGLSWVLYGLTTLVLFARDGLRPKWISSVTQVPAVVGMVGDTFSDVFPSPLSGARRSFAHLQLARGIMRRASRGVRRRRRGRFRRGALRHHRRLYRRLGCAEEDPLTPRQSIATNIYNAFCARELDYARGDDVLQLGRIDLAGARRYLQREVPPGSLPSLLAASAVLALQRLVLPVASLAGRQARLRQLAAAGTTGQPMTPGMIADSIVNLCGAHRPHRRDDDAAIGAIRGAR